MTRDPHVLKLRISGRRLPGWLTATARAGLERALGFKDFNAIHRRLPPGEPRDFPRALLDAIGATVEWTGQSPDSIPASGPLVAISNHPFGLLESMALDSLLLSRRADVTAMAVRQFEAIPDFRQRYIFVGPRQNRRHRDLSVRGLREAFHWLARGGALLIFPASRISRFHWRSLSVADEPWSEHVAGLARRTQASVLPFRFEGRNSWLFQFAGIVSPALQDLLVIRETTNKRGWKLHGAIGRLIPPSELAARSTDREATAFLRRETEELAGA